MKRRQIPQMSYELVYDNQFHSVSEHEPNLTILILVLEIGSLFAIFASSELCQAYMCSPFVGPKSLSHIYVGMERLLI